jgi:serine/threonine protein phosphatase 1
VIFKNLLRAARAPSAPPPSPGPGRRVYAIGDVHGCLDPLRRLIDRIDADQAARGDAGETVLVFLGDIVDRGPCSAQVIDLLIELSRQRPGTRFLKGNHEEVFLLGLEGDPEALRLFCRIGGRETILSYGIDQQEYERLDYAELAVRLDDLIPPAHRDFLAAFEDMVVFGDYAFVHAGVRPERALDEQSGGDLRWIRTPFLNHRGAHAKMIVHGHTISTEVERLPNRIGVDTGAYATGRLSAIGLQDSDMWVIDSENRD